MKKISSRSLTLQVVLFTLMRMVLNMNTRMVYPFLPVIARGLGVNLSQISLVLTARSATGLLSPFATTFADRRGRRFGILSGLALFTGALALMVFWPGYRSFFLSQCLAFLGMFVAVSSVQAFLGDHVPYGQRGRLVGLTEMGWAFSFILGMPLIGWLISRSGWLAPYPLLAGLGLAAFAVLWKVIPKEPLSAASTRNLSSNFRQVFTYGPALAALVVSAGGTASNEVINLVFGDWLEKSFGLSILALGGASVVIGIAEMTGEGLTAAVSDRLGKERSVVIGFLLNALVVLTLPWLGRTGTGALAGLFCLYLTFEFAIVSSLTLITEVLPSARATLLGANVAAYAAGRGLGALLAPLAYAHGFRTNTYVALALTALVLLAVSRIKIKPVPASSRPDETPVM